MRISIRRCLSMLRNTSNGNELAMPATNAYPKEHSVSYWKIQLAAHALVCRGSRLDAALAAGHTFLVVAQHSLRASRWQLCWLSLSCAQKAIEVV